MSNLRYNLKLVTAPTIEPLSLADARAHCRIDDDDTSENGLINAAITAARIIAETQLHRQLITQEWMVALDRFPSTHSDWGGSQTYSPWWRPRSYYAVAFDIPLSPVQTLTVQYYDEFNALQTMDPAAYEFDAYGIRPRLRPLYGTMWPATAVRLGAVLIDVMAGYGDAATDVPQTIIQWMKCAVDSMYEHRDVVQEKGQLVMNPFIDGLLDTERIVEI